MSEAEKIPQQGEGEKPISPAASPGKTPFLIPSPIPTRRTRTYSASERALKGPTFKGKVKSFCREKGHGFIIPDDGGDLLFTHVSDVDGDYVPKTGDDVSYKRCLIPPKNEKFQAVHVRIIHPAEGVRHETWDTPVQRTPSPHT